MIRRKKAVEAEATARTKIGAPVDMTAKFMEEKGAAMAGSERSFFRLLKMGKSVFLQIILLNLPT